MTVLRLLGAALAAYGVGSVPWAVIVVRIFWKQDIRTLGSGNTGATNVLRVFGAAPGIAVMALDIAKGALGVWLATLFVPAAWGADGRDWVMVLGAIASIAGAILMLAPRVMPVMAVIFVVVVAVWKHVSLGSITIAALFPGVSWWLYPERHALLAFAIAAAVLVIWRHRSNIGRIRRGEESKITFRRRAWDDLKPRDHDGSV